MVRRFAHSRSAAVLVLCLALVACLWLSACGSNEPAQEASTQEGSSQASSSAAEDVQALEEDAEDDAPLAFPTCWLAVDAEDIPAGVAVAVEYLPDLEITAHRGGVPVSNADVQAYRAEWDFEYEGLAVVSHEGRRVAVDPGILLVNLPDVLDGAVFDVAYSYAATSNVAGMEIPGITGCHLNGYADGKQQNAYLGKEEFVVPCAYGTALKAREAASALSGEGYRLLVFDAYRPMTAQIQLSNAFEEAYYSDPAIQEAVLDWGTGWFVASGASGHNYGTDLDVGVCDSAGNPLPMPSSYDAFDETGCLTAYPVSAAEITPDAYREEIIENQACMALHEAFTGAGFSELASEWWHFADDETESQMRALAGDVGLDFIAQ